MKAAFLLLVGSVLAVTGLVEEQDARSSSSELINFQNGKPVDLYLAVDQSGSIFPKFFDNLLDFGEALTFGVSEITGLYTNSANNGLRLTLVTFGCYEGRTKDRIRLESDRDAIEQKFNAMRDTLVTGGPTCLEGAVDIIEAYVRDASDETPERASAVVILTDGRFDDFPQFYPSKINELKGWPNTNLFTVGIGDAVREPQLLQIATTEDFFFHVEDEESLPTLIDIIASYVVDSFFADIVYTDTRESVDFSSSATYPCSGRSLSAKLFGQSLQAFANEGRLECDFVFSGNVPDATITTQMEIETDSAGTSVFYCLYPDLVDSVSTPVLEVYAVNTPRDETRVILSSFPLTVRRRSCSTSGVTEDEDKTCLSDDATIFSADGQGITYALESLNVDGLSVQANCAFHSSQYGEEFSLRVPAEAQPSNDRFVCRMPTSNYLQFIPDLLSLGVDFSELTDTENSQTVSGLGVALPLAVFNAVSLEIAVDGNDGTSIAGVLAGPISLENKNPYDSSCSSTDIDDGARFDVCWSGDQVVSYIGPDIALLVGSDDAQTDVTLGCLFTSETGRTFFSAAAESAGSALNCPIPPEMTDPSTQSENIVHVLPVANPESINAVQPADEQIFWFLSDSISVGLDVSFCGEINGETAEFCLGDNVAVSVYVESTLGQQRFANAEESGVRCRFYSESSDIYTDRLPTAGSDSSTFICAVETVQDGAFGQTFSDLLLVVDSGSQANIAPFATKSLIATNDPGSDSRCLAYNKFLEGEATNNFRTCWGASNGIVQVYGDSASALADYYLVGFGRTSQTENFVCKFNYHPILADVAITVVAAPRLVDDSDTSLGFYCDLPDEVFIKDLGGSAVTLDILVEKLDGTGFKVTSQDMEVELDSSTRCFSFALTNQDDEDQTNFCYGDSLKIDMSGESVSRIISRSVSDDSTIEILGCMFANIEVGEMQPVIIDGESLSCDLPYVSGLRSPEFMSTEASVNLRYRIVESGVIADSLIDQFSGPLGVYRLDTCLTPEIPQRYVIDVVDGTRTLEGEFCAGSGYEIEFTGSSINRMVSLLDVPEYNLEGRCRFYRRDQPEVVLFANSPMIVRGENTRVTCVAERWDPYLQPNMNYYDLVDVDFDLVESNTDVSDPFSIALDNPPGQSSFCLGEPDYGIDDYENPTARKFSGRVLQDGGVDCYPTCCQRPNIVENFGAYSPSAYVMINSEYRDDDAYFLRCSFEHVEVAADGSPIFTEGPADLNEAGIFCPVAPGWEFNGNAGDYKALRIWWIEAATNAVVNPIYNTTYEPSTGSQRCVFIDIPDNFCLGQPVTFDLNGLTLTSLRSQFETDYNADLFNFEFEEADFEDDNLLLTVDTLKVNSLWKRFDESRGIPEISLRVEVQGQTFYETEIDLVSISNDFGGCLDTERADSVCAETTDAAADLFNSELIAAGDAVSNYPPEDGLYECVFFSEASGPDNGAIQQARVNFAEELVECVLEDGALYDLFRIIYTFFEPADGGSQLRPPVILKEGQLIRNQTGCDSETGAGGESRGLAGPIAGLFVLFLLIAIIVLFVVRRRQNGSDTSSVVGGMAGPAVIFKEGDRVEMCFTRSKISESLLDSLVKDNIPSEPLPEGLKGLEVEDNQSASGNDGEEKVDVVEDCFWFKGTVTSRAVAPEPESATGRKGSNASAMSGDHSDLEAGKEKPKQFVYDVTLDDGKHISTNMMQVPQNMLREVATDYAVGNDVAAPTTGEDTQVAGVVKEVLANDRYRVEVASSPDGLVLVGSSLTILKKMEFKEGDVVAVQPLDANSGESTYTATVKEARFVQQSYLISTLDHDLKTEVEVSVPAERVSLLEFNVSSIVQVQDQTDPSIWRRAVVVAKNPNSTYDLLHSLESIGKESSVPVNRLRFPIFTSEQKVEVLRRGSRASDNETSTSPAPEDWQPGVIKSVKTGDSYEVYLNRKDEMATVSSIFLRAQELDEIILRVRKGVPLRKVNLDGNVPDSGEGVVPKAQRFVKRRPIDYTELPNHQFDITIPSDQGLGVRFGWTKDKKVIVAGFRDMPNGDWGALEATGLVMLKDQLVRINNDDVSNYGISDVTDLILKSKEKGTITIRFGRPEEYMQNFDESQDGDVVQS